VSEAAYVIQNVTRGPFAGAPGTQTPGRLRTRQWAKRPVFSDNVLALEFHSRTQQQHVMGSTQLEGWQPALQCGNMLEHSTHAMSARAMSHTMVKPNSLS
jgi:hypothetical protein